MRRTSHLNTTDAGVDRRRWLAALGAVLAGVRTGTAGAAPAVTLRVARTDGASPIADGAEKVMREAGRRAGFGVTFAHMPLARAIVDADQGGVDADLTRIAGMAERYPNLIQVGVPIMWADIAVFGATPDVETLTRDQIRRLRLGVPRGQFAIAKHTQGLHTVEALAPGLREMLLDRRVDALVMFLEVEATVANWRSQVYRWPYLWASEPLYFYVHRRHAALVPRLEAVLGQMAASGWIERNYREALIGGGVKPLRVEPARPASR